MIIKVHMSESMPLDSSPKAPFGIRDLNNMRRPLNSNTNPIKKTVAFRLNVPLCILGSLLVVIIRLTDAGDIYMIRPYQFDFMFLRSGRSRLGKK